MADNPDRLAQIMQRMQVSNQRSVGNRLGGANGANAPTPPSEQIDFTKNTLSPPSMAQPDDTGPGQQMPSVIQPPASSPVGMPSGGNAYSGSQPGVSPSTRDLYSLPDYSGGMGGGNSGGGFDVSRLLKMLSSYMGSQNGQPSPAPSPAPALSDNTFGDFINAEASIGAPSPNMPVNEYKPGYTPRAIPKGLKQSNSMLTAMEDYYNKQTGEHYSGGMGMSEPGSDWVRQNETGYVARDYSGQPTPDLVRLGGSRVGPSLSSLDGRS